MEVVCYAPPAHLAMSARRAPRLWWDGVQVPGVDLRLLSWRERCSDLLNARLQNWHLYLFSFSFSLSGGAVPVEALRLATGDAPGVISAPATADMLMLLRTTPALAADGSAGDF
jgi:hypothetical protein